MTPLAPAHATPVISARPTVTMRAALGSADLFGLILVGPSWLAWRVLLIALMGEALTEGERAVFKQLTGREREPLVRCEEFWGVIGRRGGKSLAIAVLVVYLALLIDYEGIAAIGERLVVLCLAQNAKQAQVVFGYVRAIIKSVPAFARMIASETGESLSLTNGIDIEIRAASFRGVRGVSCVAVVCDEVAWFGDEGSSSNPDSAIFAALRPSLATTNGLLAAISSPYARRGELWRAYSQHYGEKGDPLILVAQGASRDLNPSLPQRIVDRAFERDPANAASEYGGAFRTDIENFVSPDVVDGATFLDRIELPPVPSEIYRGFVDPSGGSVDAMTLAIAHTESDVAILDAVREVRPPFSPDAVVTDFAELLRRYRVREVTGDRWGGEFVREQFENRGISYRVSDRTKSELYKELLPLLNSRRVELLDIPRLSAQLCGLERRTARGGRDSIDHAPGAHDDLINAAAGVLAGLNGGAQPMNQRGFYDFITNDLRKRAEAAGELNRG
jgi:hypothetical protein